MFNIVLFHNDRFTFYYTQSVLFPGKFGASILVWVPKKSSSTPPRSFFFYQTDKLISFVLSLLKVGHLTHLLLSQVEYGRRKPQRFHTKRKKNSSLNPHALQLLPIEHATGEHSKKLEHC